MTANLTSASHADNSRYPQETGRSRFFARHVADSIAQATSRSSAALSSCCVSTLT